MKKLLVLTVFLTALGVSGAFYVSAAPHPRIRKAIFRLKQARYNLEHAAHDFGGHRVLAIRDINFALRQLQYALNFAAHHGPNPPVTAHLNVNVHN
jgi:hypothetical protein